jgi:hypothetical protein
MPITEAEIKSIIHSLKPQNSSGYDEINSKIVKTCASVISHPLTSFAITQYVKVFSLIVSKLQ